MQRVCLLISLLVVMGCANVPSHDSTFILGAQEGNVGVIITRRGKFYRKAQITSVRINGLEFSHEVPKHNGVWSGSKSRKTFISYQDLAPDQQAYLDYDSKKGQNDPKGAAKQVYERLKKYAFFEKKYKSEQYVAEMRRYEQQRNQVVANAQAQAIVDAQDRAETPAQTTSEVSPQTPDVEVPAPVRQSLPSLE